MIRLAIASGEVVLSLTAVAVAHATNAAERMDQERDTLSGGRERNQRSGASRASASAARRQHDGVGAERRQEARAERILSERRDLLTADDIARVRLPPMSEVAAWA
jgi:hypothetical protein